MSVPNESHFFLFILLHSIHRPFNLKKQELNYNRLNFSVRDIRKVMSSKCKNASFRRIQLFWNALHHCITHEPMAPKCRLHMSRRTATRFIKNLLMLHSMIYWNIVMLKANNGVCNSNLVKQYAVA